MMLAASWLTPPRPTFVEAIRKAISFGWPATVTVFFAMITLTSTQIFIGQLGDARQTAAVGLGNLIINVFANSIAIGLGRDVGKG